MSLNQDAILNLYSDKEVFTRKLAEGYTELCVGTGSWVYSEQPVHSEQPTRLNFNFLEKITSYFSGQKKHSEVDRLSSMLSIVPGQRILALFAFYKPVDENVATLEYPKQETPSGMTMRCSPFEQIYDAEKFSDHASKYKIVLNAQTHDLAEIVNNLNKN